MEQLRKLLECEECEGVAVVSPLSELELKYCPFCGSKLIREDEEQ